LLALSTSWNKDSCKSGKKIVEEIRNLGFKDVELCFSHTPRNLSQIKETAINVLSLHNFCPIPDNLPIDKALPDYFSLASPNIEERKKAIKFTKRTILCAKGFKAKAVVLHTGRVEIPDYTKRLIALLKNKPKEFLSVKEKAIKHREDNKKRFLDSVFLSIKELADFSYNEGIRLGIENRIYLREIPNFEEIKIFLDNFSNKGVGYWHDTGHAYILEKLGFAKHIDYLKRYARHLIGIHLHDVEGLSDHRAPFTGEIDFTKFKPYLNKDTIKVIEAHQPATQGQIIYAKEKLEGLFN
jgi:sugar phosphate isomerase/epimerase